MKSLITLKYKRLLDDWKKLTTEVTYGTKTGKLGLLEQERSIVANLLAECDSIQSQYLGQNGRSDYWDKQLKEIQETAAKAQERLSELDKEILTLNYSITKEEITKEGTSDLERAIKLFGADGVGARVKCSYAELYLPDGRKVFSLQKSAEVNNAPNFLLLAKGYRNNMVECVLTVTGYRYLCNMIEGHNSYTDGVYSELVPYLFINTGNEEYQRSYKPIKFLVPSIALRFYPADMALWEPGQVEQGEKISDYEVDQHNAAVEAEKAKLQEEMAAKKKQITLLALAAGAISLLTFN